MPEAREGHSGTSGVNAHTIFAGFIIAYGSSFQQGYNIGVLNQPWKLITAFYNDTYTARRNGVPLPDMDLTLLMSFTTAVMFIPGTLIGAILGGWLADVLGRKGTILMSHVFLIIGIILCVICVPLQSPELLMLSRVFIGIQIAVGNCVAPMFLQEIVQPHLRGAFGTLHQLGLTFGILMGSVFGLSRILGAANRWQYLILLEIVPVIASYALLPLIHESPRFLMLVKQDAEGSRRSLEFYRMSKEVDGEMAEMEAEGRGMEVHEQRTVLEMFSSDIRMAMLITCMLQVAQQLSGINAIFFYSSSVFTNAGVPEHDVQYAILGTNALNVVITIVAVPLMNIAGRRKLLLIPIVAIVVILSGLIVSLHFQSQYPFTAEISVVCVQLYVVAFAVGLGPIPLMIGSELFRQDARSKAMAAGGMVNLTGTFIMALGFEPVQKVLHEYTFAIFVGSMCCIFVFVYFFVPETKNRTFEDVASELAGGRRRTTVTPAVEGR